jgi:phosphoserine phosphatase
MKANWQLQKPIDAVVFDCDGTLSLIEGIDELAKNNGVNEAVRILTEEAMGKTGINPDLYKARLELVRPTFRDTQVLGNLYWENITPDVFHVISILKRLSKTIYIVSAGIEPAVIIFGEKLGISSQHIFAVKIIFDHDEKYLSYDHSSPLIDRDGKRAIIANIKKWHSNILFIGDGLNDLPAIDLVTRFVGYGGSYYRENIAKHCEFYITTLSMSPLLPLALTANEVELLTPDEKKFYEMGLQGLPP